MSAKDFSGRLLEPVIARHPTTERRWHAIERKGAADVLPKTNLKRGLILNDSS
jgi:hypothetical protein